MTREEIAKAVNEWGAKRDTLLCPMVQMLQGAQHTHVAADLSPCIKEKCRFYCPHISGRVVGPNLPPLLDLQWMCLFDQMFNQTSEVMGAVSRAQMPAVTRPGISGLSIPPGSLGRGPN